MRILKSILFILLFLITIVFTFNGSRPKDIESFISFQQTGARFNQTFFKYPPGVYIVYKNLLRLQPSSAIILETQPFWIAWKITFFTFYLLTWLALLYLTKTKKLVKPLDLSLAFFGSLSISLIALSLGLPESLSLPFQILSFIFLFRKKTLATSFFYLTAVFFNWYLLILAPLYLVFIWKNNPKTSRLFLTIIYLLIPFSLFLYLLKTWIEIHSILPSITSLAFLNFPNLFNLNKYISNSSPSLFGLGIFILPFIAVLVASIFKNAFKLKTSSFVLIFINGTLLIISALTQSLNIFFLLLFTLLFVKFIKDLGRKKTITARMFLQALLLILCTGSLFFGNFTNGNLVYIPLISLVIYVFSPKDLNKNNLFAINVVTFLSIFLFNGVTGVQPINGFYFELFRIFVTFGILFYYTKVINGIDFKFIKIFLVALLIIFNFSLLSSDGSPDIVSWRQYSQALSIFPDPFYAQSIVDQRYPPISTAILGIFTHFWKDTFGLKPVLDVNNISVDYGYPAKLSVLTFYFLTLWLIIKISNYFKNGLGLTKSEKWLSCLTVFALIVQTQGFVDFNIHVIPTLVLSVFALFKRKYLLSGLLMGLTISIKWQPIILIPVFGATLFTLDSKIKEGLKKSLKFLCGLLLIPIVAWTLVIIQPGGKEAFGRSFDYLKAGAPMLSGQALNLNWIVTYGIHMLKPEADVSLQHLGGLNRQVPTAVAPKIFRGFFFLITSFIILSFYWLKQKKTFVNFLGTSTMIFFSHQILNKSAYEKHLFYPLILLLFLYLIRPTKENRILLYIFDVMTIMNLVFFYGFTGPKVINRLVFGFDITVLFSFVYLVIYFYIFAKYLNRKLLVFEN